MARAAPSAAATEYTFSITSDARTCSSLAPGSSCGSALHSFMMAISPECVAAARRFTMAVSGQVGQRGRGPRVVGPEWPASAYESVLYAFV